MIEFLRTSACQKPAMEKESNLTEMVQTAADDAGDTLGKLITEVASGDDSALESLYDQTIGKVYALAFAITKSHEEAEEIACDVYTQVWVKACNFSTDRGCGMAWLMTICRSRSLDALRRKQVRISSDGPDSPDPEDTETESPEVALSRFQQSAEITRALGALSGIQRDAVMLAYFRGSSHGDVAAVLGLPLGTVKSHLRRALQSLQNVLELRA